MGLVGTLRDSYELSPAFLRLLVGVPVGSLPPGWRYGGAYRGARALAIQYAEADAKTAERMRSTALRDYLEWAGTSVPYYRSLFRELGFSASDIQSPSDIEALPVLTKSMVRELGDALRPDVGYVSGRTTSTGGTSGTPLSFEVTHDASAAEWAFVQHMWSMCGYSPRSRRAVLRGQLIPGRAEGAIGWLDPLNHALLLSSSDLSSATSDTYLRELKRYSPSYLHAYPSTACTLARLLGRDAAQSLGLKGILLSSENIYDSERQLLVDSFGAPVISLYGLSEKVAMACQCDAQASFHVAEGHSYIELIDARGATIHTPSQLGTIVGTSLLNRGTALIRYNTGDSATYAEGDCPCGRLGRRLDGLVGHRDLEVLYASDGSAIPATAFLHAVHHPAFALALRLQFVQEECGKATLNVELGPDADGGVAEALRAVFAQRLENRVELSARVVEAIRPGSSGKFRHVVTHVGPRVRPNGHTP